MEHARESVTRFDLQGAAGDQLAVGTRASSIASRRNATSGHGISRWLVWNADFSKGFPPTLIQGGTKELFLSHFVRLYQAIGCAGFAAKLDLYDGMPHVFQPALADAPEGRMALRKMREFLGKHLAE